MSANPFYNGTGLERLRVLARLTEGPATDDQLRQACQSQDPGACIRDLCQQGHAITMHRLHRVGKDGSVAHVGLYALKVSRIHRAALRSE